jgi:hypothetical protein
MHGWEHLGFLRATSSSDWGAEPLGLAFGAKGPVFDPRHTNPLYSVRVCFLGQQYLLLSIMRNSYLLPAMPFSPDRSKHIPSFIIQKPVQIQQPEISNPINSPDTR